MTGQNKTVPTVIGEANVRRILIGDPTESFRDAIDDSVARTEEVIGGPMCRWTSYEDVADSVILAVAAN